MKNPAGFNGGDSIRYVYDKAGNRTRKYRGASGTDQINIYRQSDNELLYRDKIPYLEDQYAYEYDANGNLTQSFDEPGTRTYAYDFENRLTKVKQGSDSTVFFYNGVGVRLKKLGTKDSSLQYIPDGMYTAVERRTNGNLRYKYVYANGLLLARIDSAGTTYYYSHDALGSIIGANADGAVYKSFLYDEFGDSLGAWGATSINNYRYTGQEYDWTPVNAYNLRAREYYPKLGRFMQNDPIGDKGGSLNWYGYVANNPINMTDITGLSCGPGKLGDYFVPDSWITYSFEPACDMHDKCYGTCGKKRSQCDNEFLDFMWWICDNTLGRSSLSYRHCREMASIYYLAVRKYGQGSYDEAQKCCK